MQSSFLVTEGFLTAEMAHLLETTWIAVPNWKWTALAALIALGLVLLPVLRLIFGRFRRVMHGRQDPQGFFKYFFSLPLERPWSRILVALIWLAGLDNLELTPNLNKYLQLAVHLMLAINLIILVHRSITAVGLLFERISRRTGTGLDQQLIPFAVRSLQVLVVVLGFLITLQNLGVNVVSILAGLGLGGLALALAAQDTAANVFGSITILFDRPFKIGDSIRIGNTEGVVEAIGFRSTRIRTPYNSLISIPNSIVAKEQVDNMEVRPRRRIRQTLGLLYETPPAKVHEFTARIRQILLENKHVDPKSVLVAFNHFNAASLDVLVNFHLPEVRTQELELEITQDLFCRFLEAAATLGVEYAYPTQTVYLKRDGSATIA
ncbi:MAG: mechanosensitive ion channel [Bdellovibrionaceae bacterium]|nr:mechanosensitive ion channel [Pseudobdellovibrionaceae bacterium]